MSGFLTLHQSISRLVVLASVATALVVSCADSVTESRQCRLNEQIWLEESPDEVPWLSRFGIIAVSPQYDEPIEFGQIIAGETDSTYLESSLFGSYLRAVFYRINQRNDPPPYLVSWEGRTGIVDPVTCVLDKFLIVGIVDDGTARMRFDGVEATRPVASGGGSFSGPAAGLVSSP